MRVVAVVALAACSSPPKGPTVSHTPLAQLHGTVVHVLPGAVSADIDAIVNTNTDDCTGLAKDAEASYQGVPIPITDAYVAMDGSCHTIELGPMSIDAALAVPPFELVIADATETWTINFAPETTMTAPTMLKDNEVVTSTWPNGPPITEACAFITKQTTSGEAQWAYECTGDTNSFPAVPMAGGNTFTFQVPQFLYEQGGASVDLTIFASGTFDVSTPPICGGPARCIIDAGARVDVTGIPVSP